MLLGSRGRRSRLTAGGPARLFDRFFLMLSSRLTALLLEEPCSHDAAGQQDQLFCLLSPHLPQPSCACAHTVAERSREKIGPEDDKYLTSHTGLA